jgi:hypothetical protein
MSKTIWFASLIVTACLAPLGCSEAGPRPAAPAEPEQVAAREPARWVCRDYDRATEKLGQRTMILEQTDKKGLTEGEKLAFSLSLYEGAETYPSREADGHAETEDVVFSFASDDGSLSVHLYLDELGETSVTVDGQESDFLCQSGHLVCADLDRETDTLEQRTLVFTKTDRRPLVEGQLTAFEVEFFEGAATYRDRVAEGVVETEDVLFTFRSKDGSVGFRHYMDEADQAGLTIDGRESGDFLCR